LTSDIPAIADIEQTSWKVGFVPILLRKAATASSWRRRVLMDLRSAVPEATIDSASLN
jgi:hypothetical protein